MRRILLVVAAFLFAVSLVACGDDDDDGAAEDTTTTSEEEPTSTTAADEDEATVQVADSSLGEILVDSEGRTVYLLTRDTGTTSTCTGQCAQTWPHLEAEGEPSAGEGIDESLLGRTERDDGSTQVTYNDHPLYLFSGDQAAGDTNGQGVGQVWFAVTPDGEAAEG